MHLNTSSQDSQRSGFPIGITKTQLREDILNVYLLQARTTYLVTPEDTAWPLAGEQRIADLGRLWDPDLTPLDLEIRYADIQDIQIARALEQQYDLGFLGLLTPGLEPMHYETLHMWVAAYLMDLRDSQLVAEWESYGVSVEESVLRCLHICELANARLTLEDREAFSYFAGIDGSGKKGRRGEKGAGDRATSLDGLTVRQMALLSGMEEMSIRTAASRSGPHQLPTFKDENRRTLIKTSDARQWLKAKGRYVPITTHPESVDLATVKFRTVDDFNGLLLERMRHLIDTGGSVASIEQAIAALMRAHGFEPAEKLTREMLKSRALIEQVAKVLEFPAGILSLRARQAALQDELNELDVQVRNASVASAEPNSLPPAD